MRFLTTSKIPAQQPSGSLNYLALIMAYVSIRKACLWSTVVLAASHTPTGASGGNGAEDCAVRDGAG